MSVIDLRNQIQALRDKAEELHKQGMTEVKFSIEANVKDMELLGLNLTPNLSGKMCILIKELSLPYDLTIWITSIENFDVELVERK